MNTAYPELFELSVAEKLKLIGELWDSIAENPSQVPVPEWHLEELERREKEHLQNPQPGESWEVVKQRLLDRNG
jgi:putative addiction module component (TIGR02574 family)